MFYITYDCKDSRSGRPKKALLLVLFEIYQKQPFNLISAAHLVMIIYTPVPDATTKPWPKIKLYQLAAKLDLKS